ncbi:DUF3572 family protein [Lichenihabitans psoromatis]|uniref:DUF3572 family protein n=1 Tax=Lichenihabitans psoromatis TaxID=2528642 RepID=UPI00103830D8|nr:DUF3572 family protein [Lichenihabitans psoromatis]
MTKRPDMRPFATRSTAGPAALQLDAEALAATTLTFLAADPDRLGDFLATSGITVDSIRDAAGQPGFATGILTFLASRDDLIVELAAQERWRPEDLGAALVKLEGDRGWDSA